MVRLSKLPAFKELQAYMNFNSKDFFDWLESGKPERNVPACWNSELSLCKLLQLNKNFFHIRGMFEVPPKPSLKN